MVDGVLYRGRSEGAQLVTRRRAWILPTIVFSQFTGTSLWFAGNAVLPDLQRQWSVDAHALGYMLSAVQLGFIAGTLFFAFLNVADRFSPRIVFFACSLLGAFSNLLILFFPERLLVLLVFRFSTGFFLAGIYPVGMRIAAGWYQQGLGKALGLLIGALGFGASFPYLLKAAGESVPWHTVILSVSALACLGGLLMMLLVPDGPFITKGTKFNSKALILIFQSRDVRSAAFAYFGHMWELYGLLAFIPLVLLDYGAKYPDITVNIPLWCFWVMASGCFSAGLSGIIADRIGNARVASIQLAASGICCLLSPLLSHLPFAVFLGILVFWGLTVAGDSPQFSTLVARTAPQTLVGSALTIVNCLGFCTTIVSIQLLGALSSYVNHDYLFLVLSIGPAAAIFSLRRLAQRERSGANG